MSTVPISVVICGLVRDPARLMSKVTNYSGWHNVGLVGEVVYATWIGEIDRYRGLRKWLRDHAVKVLEIDEPRLILKGGHQLHQMVSLHYGLSSLEDRDQFVLKTRVDLADNHELMLHDFAHGTEAVDDFGGFGLRNRILVENAQMFYPFLCGDAQFFGRISDLRMLVNMSAEMEATMNRLAVEQTFFFEPFKRSRMFRSHFYWNLPHISEIADRREQQLKTVWESEAILSVVKAWWLVMDSYFKVGWGPRKSDMPEITCFERACTHNGYNKIIGGDRSDVISNDAFVRALVRLLPDDETKAIKVRVADQTVCNPFSVPISIFDEYEFFRRQFSDLPSPKATREGVSTFHISGAAQHYFVKATQDSASTRYHEQVTALRRENDFLKSQLNITLANTYHHRLLCRILPRSVIMFMKYRMPSLTNFYARYLMRKSV